MPVIDDIRDSRNMLKGKGFKYKLLYFWEYYRIPTLIIGCALAIIVSVIVTMIRNKPAQFQAAFINASAIPDSDACTERSSLYVRIVKHKRSYYQCVIFGNTSGRD